MIRIVSEQLTEFIFFFLLILLYVLHGTNGQHINVHQNSIILYNLIT